MRKAAEFHRIHAQDRSRQMRRRVALEAARLISEHGIRDYRQAKLKAAQRLGLNDEQQLPRNREIEDALREHQRLFQSDSQPKALRARRDIAAEAMRFLGRYEPRLVGAVLEGTADAHSAVCLHVFCDSPEEVALFLRERGVPFEQRTRTLRVDRQRSADYPVLLFSAEGMAVDLTVFPRDALRQPPLDRIDERPMRRASLAMLEAMLAEEEIAQHEQEAGNGE
ncbi:MAG TPA: hypothetical protein VJ722_03765 [Rhodanobacteraceae bacterium]|nr:hypothetical protein [Rhodanobacteraceae bacterium]